jgi:hypothetical protein
MMRLKSKNLNYTVNYCTYFKGLTNKGFIACTRRFSERVGNRSNSYLRLGKRIPVKNILGRNKVFLLKKYLLSVKVYVVPSIFVQFNRLATQSSKRYGRPKGNVWLKQLEFGISRNVCDILGKRKIRSTFCFDKIRKESSYTCFIRLVLKGSDLYKKLIKMNNQLILEGYSTTLTFILSNIEFLNLSWNFVKFSNKVFFYNGEKKLNYQFQLWSYKVSKHFLSGDLDFGSNTGLKFGGVKENKFFIRDLIIYQSIYVLLLIVFEKYPGQFEEYISVSKKLNYLKTNFGGVNWFLNGNLVFSRGEFMLIFSNKVRDQSFKDLVYKFLKSIYFISFLSLKEFSSDANSFLSSLIINICFSRFDNWIQSDIIPMYEDGGSSTILSSLKKKYSVVSFYPEEEKNNRVRIFYLRYFSNIVVT